MSPPKTPQSPLHGKAIVARPRSAKGRPKKEGGDSLLVQDALLNAAEQCLENSAADLVTVRQIAQKAGVNQAMIHYYFEDKDGLFVTLYENELLELSRKFNAFLKAIPTDDAGAYTIEALMKLIEEHFQSHPAMFTMMHHELLMENSKLSQTYNRRLAARGYGNITRIIAALMGKGRCRTDITPEHAAYFVCAVCTMPFMLRPIFNAAFNAKSDDSELTYRRRAMAKILEAAPPE
jgi:AcrR family transcriptional regulator